MAQLIPNGTYRLSSQAAPPPFSNVAQLPAAGNPFNVVPRQVLDIPQNQKVLVTAVNPAQNLYTFSVPGVPGLNQATNAQPIVPGVTAVEGGAAAAQYNIVQAQTADYYHITVGLLAWTAAPGGNIVIDANANAPNQVWSFNVVTPGP